MDSHKQVWAPDELVPLQPFSTIGVGGAARWFARAGTLADVQSIHRWCTEHDTSLFVLGGGSNVIISDDGFDGLVMQMSVNGVTVAGEADSPRVTAGAGESWDRLVAFVVEHRWSGIECLSGIPGTVGGTPIQNVGAYGQEVASVITAVTAFDRSRSTFAELTREECGFSYRMSRFKSDDADHFVVCGVTMQLAATTEPPRYPDLIAELGRRGVTSPEPAAIRDAVLAIRRRKGMVLDAADPDTRSVGSFFMNPVVTHDDRERIAALAGASVPGFATADERVKIPAAWLIEHAGLGKGAGG